MYFRKILSKFRFRNSYKFVNVLCTLQTRFLSKTRLGPGEIRSYLPNTELALSQGEVYFTFSIFAAELVLQSIRINYILQSGTVVVLSLE